MGAETITETQEVSELFSPDTYKKLMGSCETQGGVLEKVTTPAGTYDTCKTTIKEPNGRIIEKWWGDIPFGVVSKNTRGGLNEGAQAPNIESVTAGL